MTTSEVQVVDAEDVATVPLPKDSWSKVLVSSAQVSGNTGCLGMSVFTPGTETADMRHTTEELAYVLTGHGELRLENDVVPFAAGQALFIPADVWHVVANTGAEDVQMVFAFAHPDYPPTERR